MIGLSPCTVAGSRDSSGQRVHRWADDPFVPEPVAGQLEQHSGRVVFQGPGEEECIELLAVTGCRGSPTEPSEHKSPVVAPGAALPSAVCGQHARHVVAGKSELRGDAVYRGQRAGGQVIRYPAEPRQCAELEGGAESVLDSHVRGEPTEIVAGQREYVIRSASAISSGQPLSLASSASDRSEPA